MMDIKKYNPMIVVFIIAFGTTVGAKEFIDFAGSGGWLLAILYTVAATLVYSVLFKAEAIYGFSACSVIMKKIFALLLTLCGLFYASSLIACIADNITTVFLNNTPVEYILLLLVLPGAVGCWFGTRTVSRYALAVAVGGIIVVLLVFFMCFGEYDVGNLYPLFGNGVRAVIRGVPAMGIFVPVLFYYAILLGNKVENVRGNVARIVFCSGMTISLVCFGINLLMPYSGAEVTSMPLYTLAASVRGNYLIERSESVVLILWLFCSYVSVAGIASVVSNVCAYSFKLDNRNALTGALCGIIFASGVMLCDLNVARRGLYISSSVLGIFSVVMPLLINIRYRVVR